MAGEPDGAFVRSAVGFAWALRRAGLPVGLSRIVSYMRALAAVDATRREDVYWAGRLTLCARREDLSPYDMLFDEYWGRAAARYVPEEYCAAQPELPRLAPIPRLETESQEVSLDEAPDADAGEEQELLAGFRYSPEESLRKRDFSDYAEEDLAAARRLMAAMRLAAPLRRSHRRVRASRGVMDLGGTIRRSRRTLGEPLRWELRAPRRRPRRLVFLCDVSGSMSQYSRSLLLFLHAALRSGANIEAFCFGTRLTRVTRELSPAAVDQAIARASARVPDWSGGTRIGQSLKTFCDRWGQRGMARGAIVVIMSDGWDTGEPGLLAEQMARLRRLTHRLIWVNPLKASPGYQPLARGMAAAMPSIDEFLPGHNLSSLVELAAVVRQALRPRMQSKWTAGTAVVRHGRD